MRLFYRTQNSFFQIVHILKSSFLKDSDHLFHWLKYGDWSPFLPRPASSSANARAGQLLWLSSAFLMHAVILLLLWDHLSLPIKMSSSSFSNHTFALWWLSSWPQVIVVPPLLLRLQYFVSLADAFLEHRSVSHLLQSSIFGLTSCKVSHILLFCHHNIHTLRFSNTSSLSWEYIVVGAGEYWAGYRRALDRRQVWSQRFFCEGSGGSVVAGRLAEAGHRL